MAVARPRLYQLLAIAQHRLKKRADAACREQLGISASQLGLLLNLDLSDGRRMSDLASSLGVNKSAMTKLADRLLSDGLIERVGCSRDARASELHLTPRGKALLEDGRTLEREMTRTLIDGFTEAEIETVARFLRALIERTR